MACLRITPACSKSHKLPSRTGDGRLQIQKDWALFRPTFLQDHFSTPNPQVCCFYFWNLVQKENSLVRRPDFLTKGVKVLETAVGAVFASTRFSLVRISIRDQVADGKSLVRSSGVGGGGQNRILIPVGKKLLRFCLA